MKFLKWLGVSLAVLLLAVAGALGVWVLLPAATPPIEGEPAVASLERVVLGGVEQTILVRGRDRSNPVLLYLHGGPGLAHLPLARFYSAKLEEQLVVVHWDQRGAGASCEGVERSSMTLERVIEDTIELSEQLAARFGGDGRIILLGHSWGSVVGALAVQRRPDLYHAYIGLGQLVHGDRNEVLSYGWVLAEAERRGDEEALAELRAITPPYEVNEDLGVQRRWLNSYNGSLYAVDRVRPALWPLLFAREYTLGTRLAYGGCFTGSLDAMWGEVAGIDFPTQIPRLDVPVFFFTGRHDWNTPYPLVEEWAADLEAPHVEIVWFDDAGHMPPLESPDAFQDEVLARVLPTALPGRTR